MDWYADQSRIWRERDYLRLVQTILPANVPHVLFSDDEHYLLGMSAVSHSVMWKQLLLDGQCDPEIVGEAARLLAVIHSYTYQHPELADPFRRKPLRSQDSFEQLRIDPYLRTIARRHPDRAATIDTIIRAMEANVIALVHGDYSPKNILARIGAGPTPALTILDAEVAHWGDPTFDVAFCINHLLLKAVYHHPNAILFLTGAEHFWQTYQLAVQPPGLAEAVNERLSGQVAALLLARIDGKSPVEYLVGDTTGQTLVRNAARALLARYPVLTFAQIIDEVKARLNSVVGRQ
ncbi:MAG: aminoglycoside phosphotransferase family protein [Chloroflexota bacterium]|nr:aminoglycoside phosphotransferase family protein [Chloroflexota bacterium]